MPSRIPRSIKRFCRTVLPLLQKRADGQRILSDVAAIVETDRWNSFDRFHDTTRTLVRRYESSGARVEVHPIPTGGRIGSGRWIIHEAVDIRSATLDVLRPVRQRLLSYKENPWHVVHCSAGTPRSGLISELVILDTPEELDRIPSGGLTGKVVLTRLNLWSHLNTLSDKSAAGVISDRPVPNLPDAVPWIAFGWGGIPIENAAVQLVGLVLSENQGKALRALSQQNGPVTLHTKVDIRRYVGSHDVVSAVIPGRDDPQNELWVIAHSAEAGALDNASGVAVSIEIARLIEGLIAQGLLPRPRRSIRLINGYECYGFFNYLENVKRFQTPLAGICLDTVGSKLEVCEGRLEWHATLPMSAGFVDRVGEGIIRAALRLDNPGYRLYPGPFIQTSDTLIGDPQYGFPCPWLTTLIHYHTGRSYDAYHSSADTLDLVSPQGLAVSAAAVAGYLYYLADAGRQEVVELATSETDHTLNQLEGSRREVSPEKAAYLRDQHRTSLEHLRRWMWGGDRSEILAHLTECERRVRQAGPPKRPSRKRSLPGADRIPRRTAFLSPTLENTPPPIAKKIREAHLPDWALFWADGNRTLADIARVLSVEQGKEAPIQQVISFFEAHHELGYVELIAPQD